MEPIFVKEQWVIKGERHLSDGSLAVSLVRVVDGKARVEEDPILFGIKAFRHARPGMVYEAETTREGDGIRMKTTAARYVGTLKDEALVTQWQAEAVAQRAAYDLQQYEKKAAATDPMVEALRPIAEAYRRASGHGKRALLARVVEIVATGRGLK